MGWTSFLLAYLLGGITFLPFVVVAVLAHAYYFLPRRDDGGAESAFAADGLVQPGDDLDALKAAKETAKASSHHEQDVAAGYFAVCREYTPMGINAKPIERTTPVGSTTVASPSPSVYQTMYRSIFERKAGPGPLDNHGGASQRPRKAGNVFYVVLRHGHLMLFDDDEQLEVRHVVSLAHHNVNIYSGEDVIPEGELFIKRNAICLSRRTDGPEIGPDSQFSKPFFLFSENCSAKEDFYFALLRNQEQSYSLNKNSPSPIQFDVKNIIALVQKLHSSEEHMQTRWLNAMIGRLFLGMHKTKDMEIMIREKLMKKISRVKRPAFLSKIAIRGIDTGESAPYITNPRLKDLTVEGECGIEADMKYTGNFRLEVAATARIDLGARFKAREVDLVLAVVIRKMEGHMLFKIKPPPSNRLWYSFQQAPKLEMTIEPIVSSRQITYAVILRQIESRIKEVIAETLVLPFWDDMPFFNTEHKKWRGGIFQDDTVQPSVNLDTVVEQEADMDDVEVSEDTDTVQPGDFPTIEKSHSVPVLEKKSSVGLFGRRMSIKSKTDSTPSPSASTTSVDTKIEKTDTRPEAKEAVASRSIPSASIVQPPAPIVVTDATNADIFKPSSSPPNESPAVSAMSTLSARTHSPSPAQAQAPSPFKPYVTSRSSHSSSSSHEVTDAETDADVTPQGRRNTASSAGSQDDSGSMSPSLSTRGSIKGQAGFRLFGRRETATPPTPVSPGVSDGQRRGIALSAVSNVAASAKQWGLNALQRHANKTQEGQAMGSDSTLDLSQPMGRGQPLPPPGTPLPMPDKASKTAPISVPRRKPVAPPPPLQRPEHTDHAQDRRRPIPPPQPRSEGSENVPERRRPMPPPALPMRRQVPREQPGEDDSMLVVAAPADSEPATPLSHSPKYAHPYVEDSGEPSSDTAVPVEAAPEDSFASGGDPGKADTIFVEPTASDDDDYSAWMDNADEPMVEAGTAAVPVKE